MSKPKILLETANYLIVDKPAGILSYPLPGNDEKTIGDMLNALPVHRLDRDTSGVLLLAKSENAKKTLQALFKERSVEKRYLALVWGRVEPESGVINIPLGRGSKDRLRVVPKSGGRDSVTEYKVKKYFTKTTLLDVNLKTGRTHQIRVHFNAIGHPVVGDKKYSKREADLSRQFLHANHISFVDPITNNKVEVKSELPDELEKFLKTQK